MCPTKQVYFFVIKRCSWAGKTAQQVRVLAAQVWNPRLHVKYQCGFPDLYARQEERFGEKDKKQKQKDFWGFITASQQRGGGTAGNKFSERLCQGIRQALLEEDSSDLHTCAYTYTCNMWTYMHIPCPHTSALYNKGYHALNELKYFQEYPFSLYNYLQVIKLFNWYIEITEKSIPLLTVRVHSLGQRYSSAGEVLGQQASATHLLHFYFLFLVWCWKSKPGLEYARTLYQPSLKILSATTISSQETTHQHNPICMSISCQQINLDRTEF